MSANGNNHALKYNFFSKIKKKNLRRPVESEGGEGGEEEHRDEKSFLEPPREFHSGG